MADNVTAQSAAPATIPAGTIVAARLATYSGDSALIAPVGLATFAGSDDAKTATDVPGGGGVEAAALRVTIASDSTGQVKLAAGANVIGHVIVDTAPSTAVTGPLTDAQLRATAVPVSGPLTDTQLRATPVPVSGTVTANAGTGTLAVSLASVPSHAVTNAGTFAVQASVPAVAVAAAVSQVAGSASSVTLLSSNAARKGFKLFNDSTAIAYVKEGTTAVVASDHSYQIQPKGYYESVGVGVYTGRIDCIWASATGNMRVTENT